MRIGIIGSGIGGLAAALSCQRQGIDFDLFDPAENPLSGGVALTLWPNGLGVLDELGVMSHDSDWMHPIQNGSLRTDGDAVLYHLPLDWMHSTYGYRPTCVRRSELVTRLYNALGAPTIQRMRCDDVILHENHVNVRFSGGQQADFDAVIAADGIHSTIRDRVSADSQGALTSLDSSQPFQPLQSRQLGKSDQSGQSLGSIHSVDSLNDVRYSAWRGIAVGAQVAEKSMCEYMGRGVRFGYATISPSETYWFATANHRLLPRGSDTSWESVADWFSGFPSAVRSCILSTPTEGVRKSRIQYVHPKTPMVRGHVALLGDAAHAITPNLGLGAGLALEDARFLLHALRAGAPIKQVFASYEQARRLRTARIARLTNYLGQGMQLENRSLIQLRNRVIRMMPNRVANLVWRIVLGY